MRENSEADTMGFAYVQSNLPHIHTNTHTQTHTHTHTHTHANTNAHVVKRHHFASSVLGACVAMTGLRDFKCQKVSKIELSATDEALRF